MRNSSSPFISRHEVVHPMRLVMDLPRKNMLNVQYWPVLIFFSLILSVEKLKSEESNESVFIMLRYINRTEVYKWRRSPLSLVCKVRSWRRLTSSMKMNSINHTVFQRICYLWNTSVYLTVCHMQEMKWHRIPFNTSIFSRYVSILLKMRCELASGDMPLL